MPTKKFHAGYNPVFLKKSRELRKNMTRQEKHLWYDFLRNYSAKFYRQRAIDWYIVDFYCAKAHLAIELDGGQHMENESREYDRLRTKILEKYDVEVLRFTNTDIDKRFDAVCTVIDRTVQERLKEERDAAPDGCAE
jgi:very-short-patch-repair endonuclease